MIAVLSTVVAAAQLAAPARPAAPAASSAAYIPPPIVSTQPMGAARTLFAWIPGTVACDGMTVAPVAMRRPLTSLAWSGADGTRTVTYRFRIDAAGRPLSIARDVGGYNIQTEDIAPSLAASRFPAGVARADCAITYTTRSTPLAEAPVADLMSYSITPMTGALPRAGWDRIMPVGTSCRTDPPPRILLRAYPDFLAFPPTPGVRGWSMVGYDLNARGRPIRVRTVGGTGNPALDTASVKAVAASRFTPGARAGCLYPYWQNPATIAAPPLPDRVGTVDTANRCPAGDWSYRPAPIYPPPWHRRAIEGWAVVAFDVAPWGDIGNVRVVASEPGADFGVEALRLLRGARKPVSATGHVGCVERIHFVMKAKAPAPADPVVPHD